MISVEPFRARDATELSEQEATAYLRPFISEEVMKALEGSPYAYTLRGADGRVVACAGVYEYWKGRGEAWALMDKNCKSEFFAVHNAVKRFLEICPVRRIEAVVDAGFEAGHRWVKALGFELEAPRLRGYRPTGGDCALYARVRG